MLQLLDKKMSKTLADMQSNSSQGDASIPWPHSRDLRRHTARSGFEFRPTTIKCDRCVCDYCGAEVWDWRPEHNPWLFHDWSKRHPDTVENVRKFFMETAATRVEPVAVATVPTAPLPASCNSDNNERNDYASLETRQTTAPSILRRMQSCIVC